jgi:hypothetical protein
MTRRLVTLALAALALAAPAIAHAAQPNVLVIVTDDQRWDTLPYMPTVQNELQAKGITFTNAFAVNPVCCPSQVVDPDRTLVPLDRRLGGRRTARRL